MPPSVPHRSSCGLMRYRSSPTPGLCHEIREGPSNRGPCRRQVLIPRAERDFREWTDSPAVAGGAAGLSPPFEQGETRRPPWAEFANRRRLACSQSSDPDVEQSLSVVDAEQERRSWPGDDSVRRRSFTNSGKPSHGDSHSISSGDALSYTSYSAGISSDSVFSTPRCVVAHLKSRYLSRTLLESGTVLQAH